MKEKIKGQRKEREKKEETKQTENEAKKNN